MANFVPVSKTRWINMDLVVQAHDRSPLGIDIQVASHCDEHSAKSIILLSDEAEALLVWLKENQKVR